MRRHYPATQALAKATGSRVGSLIVDDSKRSPTRQYARKDLPTRRGRRKAFALLNWGRPITRVFWTLGNLERHCRKRWHKYVKERPV